MGAITRGVVSIALGNVAGDGGPGTTLTALGLTKEGTAKISQADPEVTQFFAEEQEAPIDSDSKAGVTTLAWTIANPDIDTLIAVFGGTATGTTPNRIWNMPSTLVSPQQTVKVTTKKGMSIVFVNATVTAKLNGDLSRKDIFGLDMTATALASTKSGVGPIQFIG